MTGDTNRNQEFHFPKIKQRESFTGFFFHVEKHRKTSTAEPANAGHVCVEDYEQIIAAKHFGLLWAQSILDASWLIGHELTANILLTTSNYFYSQTHQSNCMYDTVLDHGFLTRGKYKSQHILKTNFNMQVKVHSSSLQQN